MKVEPPSNPLPVTVNDPKEAFADRIGIALLPQTAPVFASRDAFETAERLSALIDPSYFQMKDRLCSESRGHVATQKWEVAT